LEQGIHPTLDDRVGEQARDDDQPVEIDAGERQFPRIGERVKAYPIRIDLPLYRSDQRTRACGFGQSPEQASPRRSRLAQEAEAHLRNDGIENRSAV